MTKPLNIVVLGLTITSSWGNGHATTYRALLRALSGRGHQVTFLEYDKPWYRENRDLPHPPFCQTFLYQDLDQLRREHAPAVQQADIVVVGSYVPQGIEVGRWVCSEAAATAFYDIDTPVTLRGLEAGDCAYLEPALIPRYDIYFSFTGGSTLERLEQVYGSPRARALYCSVDPADYYPEAATLEYDLGYMGTYSPDRQPVLHELLVEAARQWPAGRFAVAGPQYPASIRWPPNVHRSEHLAPAEHRRFYNRQRFTLNVTRADMCAAGFSPSVRLFEAAACGTPIITDYWPGLETLFTPQEEILVSRSAAQTLACLRDLDEEHRRTLAHRARQRVLSRHTAAHRAVEFEHHVYDLLGAPREPTPGKADGSP